MRKLLLLVLLLPTLAYAADQSDITPGIDPTALTQITASQLLQLGSGKIINGGSITNGKGIIIRSTTTPDTTSIPRYTNWLWLDISGGIPGTLKQWNPSSASWVAAAFGISSIYASNIAPGNITQPTLATNAVDTVNIVNNAVTSAKIGAGQILNTHLGNGVVSNANIADITIQGGKIAYNTLLNTNFIDGTIDGVKLQSGSVTGTQIKTNSVTTNNIALSGSTSNQVMQTSADGTVIQWKTPIFIRSTNITILATLPGSNMGYTNAHGLGVIPTIARAVLVCTTAERGFAVGDEVDHTSIVADVGVTDNFTITCNSTNVYLNSAGGTGLYNVACKGDNARHNLTPADWSVRVYLFY